MQHTVNVGLSVEKGPIWDSCAGMGLSPNGMPHNYRRYGEVDEMKFVTETNKSKNNSSSATFWTGNPIKT
jgi:hypothetical protein